jgi:hypothetical protein
LSGVNFMQELKDFNKDNIPQATLKKLAKYIADPTMAVENVSKVSKAASSLCMWVHAMDVYSKVAKEVRVAPDSRALVVVSACGFVTPSPWSLRAREPPPYWLISLLTGGCGGCVTRWSPSAFA